MKGNKMDESLTEDDILKVRTAIRDTNYRSWDQETALRALKYQSITRLAGIVQETAFGNLWLVRKDSGVVEYARLCATDINIRWKIMA